MSHPSSPPGPRDALRVQAAAVVAQQAALAEQEARLLERQQALETREQELAGLLEQKRRQLVDLQDQLNAGRDQLRHDRQALTTLQAETTTHHREATALRDRLTGLRSRFLKRWKKHWAEQRHRTEFACRQAAEIRETTRQERERFEQFRARFHTDAELEKRRLQDERQALTADRAKFVEQKRQADDEQTAREYDLAHRTAALLADVRRAEAERQRLDHECAALRAETTGLEARIGHSRKLLLVLERQRVEFAPPALPPLPEMDFSRNLTELPGEIESAFAARDAFQRDRQQALDRHAAALADQRLHLAELYARLAKAEQDGHGRQSASAAELESLAGDLHLRDEELTQDRRRLDAAREWLRQERETLTRLRRESERAHADLVTRQQVWQGDRDRLLAEVGQREAAADRRESGLAELFRRWRDRRSAEVQHFQALAEASLVERNAWAEQRDVCRRRTDALRAAQQAMAEQELALEQARQELLHQADRPQAAAKRLERLRRRWEGLSAAARRDLEKRRAELQAEQSALNERFAVIQRQVSAAVQVAATVAADRAETEAQRLHIEERQSQIDRLRATWDEQRQLYEQQLLEMRDEAERLSRLLIDDGPTSELSSAA